jgi:hypothetical protein
MLDGGADQALISDTQKAHRSSARWSRLWRRFASRFRQDESMLILRAALQPLCAMHRQPDAPIVAVECVEHPLYCALFASICDEMRRASDVAVELVVVRSINAAVGKGPLRSVMRSALVGYYASRPWIRAFRGVANRIAYRSRSIRPLGDLRDWLRSGRIWRLTRDARAFAELRIDDVQVGDLIIDSYLRFRPSAIFQPNDRFTRGLIWQTCRDLRRAARYFRRRKPLLYLTSFSTYIEHGIAVRVALRYGVAVRSFGSFARFGKQLSRTDWFHTPDTTGYKRDFDALERQSERLSQAEEQLSTRLRGGIDAVMSYMRASAYRVTSEAVPPVEGATIVFLHDFYDSLHVYPDVVFHDFWSWVCFTVDVLQAAGRKFFVKPHPNQIPLSVATLRDLQAKYPDLPLISSGITNAQLAQAGAAVGVTMYGNVAHELAYFGIPSIACARHPHNSFDFCRTARSVAQYEHFLRATSELPTDKAEMRRQALAFYYMHNLHGAPDELALRGYYVQFWSAWLAEARRAQLKDRFLMLRRSDEFRRFGGTLRDALHHRGH